MLEEIFIQKSHEDVADVEPTSLEFNDDTFNVEYQSFHMDLMSKKVWIEFLYRT